MILRYGKWTWKSIRKELGETCRHLPFILRNLKLITAAKKNRATIMSEKSPTFPSGKPLAVIEKDASTKK